MGKDSVIANGRKTTENYIYNMLSTNLHLSFPPPLFPFVLYHAVLSPLLESE